MKWTNEQNDAIKARDTDILVSAAAGSGKTAVLTERIKQMILNDGISVENMLIVTFTNAAASEMREKILKAISSAINELSEKLMQGNFDEQVSTLSSEDSSKFDFPKTNPEAAIMSRAASKDTDSQAELRIKLSHLRTQYRKARLANISTFHSFSMSVIRKYFYLTDVEADFKICDEARGEILKGEALDELFESRFKNDNDAFTSFLRQYAYVRSEDRVRSMIMNVYTFVMSMPEPFKWLDEACAALNMDKEKFAESQLCKMLIESVVREAEKAVIIAKQVCEMTSDIPSINQKAISDLETIERSTEEIKKAASDSCIDAKELWEMFSHLGSLKLSTFRASKEDKEAYNEIKDIVSSTRKSIKEILKDILANVAPIPYEDLIGRMIATAKPAEYLAGLVKEFHERFRSKKLEKSMLEFNDIEHEALGILRQAEPAAEYRQKFEAIFVDEYQDSSILQETLIQQISRGNNVYMVGDVKQSIYKFRLAEPEIFIDKYNSFDSYKLVPFSQSSCQESKKTDENFAERVNIKGRRIDLNKNFRCKGNIIHAVNGIFSNIMNREIGGIDYDESASLKKGVEYEGELDRPVSLHIVDISKIKEESSSEEQSDIVTFTNEGTAAGYSVGSSSGDADMRASGNADMRASGNADMRASGNADMQSETKHNNHSNKEIDEELAELQSKELEASHVANLVSQRLGQKIFDSKEGIERKVRMKDIVILLRGVSGKADIYAKALKEKGITGYVEAGDDYFQTMEIEVFMNLLRVIDNKRRDIPLLSVLRSPIFDISVSELVDIRLAHRYGSFCDALLASENEKCRMALKKLKNWKMKSRYMPLDEFIWMLMIESGYYAYASALPQGDVRAANLRALVDRAAAYSSSQGKGLFGFIKYVELLDKNNVKIVQSTSSTGAENAVRIMTIHKSKGLEFPIVIVAGLGSRFRYSSKNEDAVMHKDFGIGLEYVDYESNCKSETLMQTIIKKKRKEEGLAEEMRILYVAMTRAMDELVLVGSMKNPEKKLEELEAMCETGKNQVTVKVSNPLDWILPNIKAAGLMCNIETRQSLSSELKAEDMATEILRSELENGFETFDRANELTALIDERFGFVYPYESDMDTKSKFTVSGLNKKLRDDSAKSGDLSNDNAKSEALTGESSDGEVLIGDSAKSGDLSNDNAKSEALTSESPDGAALIGDSAKSGASNRDNKENEALVSESYDDDLIAEMQFAEKRGDEKFSDVSELLTESYRASLSSAEGMSKAGMPKNWIESCSAIVPSFMKPEERITPAMRGTIMHSVLELIPYDRNPDSIDEKYVEEFVSSLIDKNLLTEKEAESVSISQIAAFLKSPVGRRIYNAEWVKREWPFTLRKHRNEIAALAADEAAAEKIRAQLPERVILQGIIDCCFKDSEGIVIVDYKTDKVNRKDRQASYARIADTYRNQLILYADVVKTALGVENVSTLLFMLSTGETIEISPQ